LPLWLWLTGAGATIVLTFAMLGLFFKSPTAPRSAFLCRPPVALTGFVKVIGVALFILALWAGFAGVQDPYRNLATTMVWIIWWVGLAFVCALVGDLWALASPLKTLFPWDRARLRYPERLGAWPAVALFFLFAWAELVWRDNDLPRNLAWAILGYAVLTWSGMFLFGRSRWLQNGEAFSLAFGVLARFAPLAAAKEGGLALRPPGAGLMEAKPVSTSMMVFVLLMLATVTFDGFLETPLNQRLHTWLLSSGAAGPLFTLTATGLDEAQLIDSVLLAVFPLVFLAVYVLVSPAPRAFVLTLVPIAVAYHLAHYFSLLLTAGQFIIPLASDPLGRGWDLFGTAGYQVDLGIVSPYVFWYGAVALILLGHVIAVYLAHVQALRLYGDRNAALKSQLPMMALMVAYTALSLWILAQPVVG
jgi:hypothetical protein